MDVTNRNKGAHMNNCVNRAETVRRMRENNPMKDPGVRGRATRKVRQMMKDGEIEPFGGRRWGNGCQTPTEREAEVSLDGLGFQSNLVIGVGKGEWRPGIPKNYRIDLGNPGAKIAVEIDGGSHAAKKRRGADERKDAYLTSRGWRVIRIRLKKGTFDASALRTQVCALLTESPPSTT